MNGLGFMGASIALISVLSLTSRSAQVKRSAIGGQSLQQGVANAAESKMKITLQPEVDVDADSAKHWRVETVQPAGELRTGDEVTLQLESDLENASKSCYAGEIGDEGNSVFLDSKEKDYASGDLAYEDIFCVMRELDIPDSTIHRMDSTRSLDGRVSDSWKGLTAEWTYHPDSGANVLITIDD
ncbi:hypothetical protein ACXA45_12015 [Neomicrococcus lactis]